MKKNLILLTAVFSIVFVGIVFISCNKNDTRSSPGGSVNSAGYNLISKTINCSPFNGQNSLDEVGEIHNQCLDAVETPVNSMAICSTISNFMSTEYSFLISLNHTVLNNLASQYDSSGIQALINIESADGIIINGIAETLLNSEYQQTHSYCDVKGYLTDIEYNVNNSGSLTTVQKNNVRVFTSTLRHSLYYWEKNSDGSNTQLAAKNVWVGLADAAAAVYYFFATEGSLGDRLKGAAAFGAGISAIVNYFF